MAYARGAGSQLQIGLEQTWGTAATPNRLLNFLSENIKFNIERIQEESILAQKTARQQDVMGYSTSGPVETILKPENAKEIFYLALGVEASPSLKMGTSGVYRHAYTLADHDASLPSFTAIVDRKAAVPKFTGNKISTLKLAAKAKDYLRASLELKGRTEEAGTLVSGLEFPTKRSFRFVNGKLTLDGSDFVNVTSVEVTLDNSLDDGEHTLGSGYFPTEMEHNERKVMVNAECFFDSDSNAVRESKYKVDGATAAFVLEFITPDDIEPGEPFLIRVTLPLVTITTADVNVAGKDKMRMALEGVALEGDAEAITIEVFDDEDLEAFESEGS